MIILITTVCRRSSPNPKKFPKLALDKFQYDQPEPIREYKQLYHLLGKYSNQQYFLQYRCLSILHLCFFQTVQTHLYLETGLLLGKSSCAIPPSCMYKRTGSLAAPRTRSDAGGSVPTASSRHCQSVGNHGCSSVFNEDPPHASGISCFSTPHQSIPYRPRIFCPRCKRRA